MRELDRAVLARIADGVCTSERSVALSRALHRPVADAAQLCDAWRELLLSDAHVGMSYLRALVSRVVVSDTEIRIEARTPPSENAPP